MIGGPAVERWQGLFFVSRWDEGRLWGLLFNRQESAQLDVGNSRARLESEAIVWIAKDNLTLIGEGHLVSTIGPEAMDLHGSNPEPFWNR